MTAHVKTDLMIKAWAGLGDLDKIFIFKAQLAGWIMTGFYKLGR